MELATSAKFVSTLTNACAQVPDEVYKKEDPLLPLPGHAQSSPAESAGVMKWMKGKGSKFHRKLIWLNRRHLTQVTSLSFWRLHSDNIMEDVEQTAPHVRAAYSQWFLI